MLLSHRRFCERLLDKGDYNLVKQFLDDDSILKRTVEVELGKCRKSLRDINLAVDTLHAVHSKLLIDSPSWPDIYILAMSGQLANSDILETALLSIRKAQSNVIQDVLVSICQNPSLPAEIKSCHESLAQLTEETATTNPDGLRSGHNIQHSNLRTTVVAQKVELSKQTATLRPQEAAYTKIIDKIDTALKGYFEANLTNPKDLFMHEICVYDLPSPHRDVLTPRPRFAIERALSSPHDYLGHECCDHTSEGLSAFQPATAILHQLYLESGSLINTADLWSAFWTIVGNEGAENEDREQQRVLALFSRALADLKYLGMVKHSRKKADHLAKLSWKGL